MTQGPTEQTPAPREEKPHTGNKPVVVYIMILFIAAFLLMALSFAMHQRSNTEALGELQSSLTNMQEVQISQEKIIDLQEQLVAAEDRQNQLEDQLTQAQADLEDANATLEDQQAVLDALTSLYYLQQAYSAQDYETCQALLQSIEEAGQAALLEDAPSLPDGTELPELTTPAQRYQQLKEAVEAQSAN